MSAVTSLIANVERLQARLAEAEAECITLATSLSQAEAAWSAALASGNPQAEAKANTTLENAQTARAQAVGRLPLLRQALQAARVNALPERFEQAEPEIDRINAAAAAAAEKLLAAHDEFLSAAALLSKLDGEHRGIVAELRGFATEAGHEGVSLPEEMAFPATPGIAIAGRTALASLRISARTLYKRNRQPKNGGA